ncbi:MAG: aspartate/glutamate racemase family protein [Nitratireductor sp.]|nr:aspartate/glutamate racemase family protein [Nitratireductor sp.]
MLIGILGGMGPAATVDFMSKLTFMTNAGSDQEHVPVVVLSDPRVPDRSAAICGNGPSPLPALFSGIGKLEAAGATLIAIPCNTSHYWYTHLAARTAVPIISIIEATLTATIDETPVGSRVGVIATAGAIAGAIYQKELESEGFIPEVLDPDTRQRLIEGGIRAVKAGDLAQGRALLNSGLEAFRLAGCQSVILGCTEASVALEGTQSAEDLCLIDSNCALVKQVLRKIGRSIKPMPPRHRGHSESRSIMADSAST